MKIAVTGSSGFIGSALVEALRHDGHDVLRLVRREPRAAGEVRWDPSGEVDTTGLRGIDGVVHLAGASVGLKLWTESYKREVRRSRVQGTRTISEAIATLDQRPRVLVSGSASGYYGDPGDRPLDENAPAGEGFFAEMCVQWEAAADPARAAGIRVVHPRPHIVLGRGGGALGQMLPVFRLGLGGRLGSGRQCWSYVSLTDEVRALKYVLTAEALAGPVNIATPNPVTNAEATAALGRVLHRPTPFPVPAVAVRAVLGEFASEVLASRRLLPHALERSGFTFAHPTVEEALRAAL